MSVRYQFVIDLLDVWIPASNLGYVALNDGVLGVFGYADPCSMPDARCTDIRTFRFITSIMALRSQWAAASVTKSKTA